MSDPKTPLGLVKEARAYADKATPGPWAQLDGFPEYVVPASERGRPLGASAYPEEDARTYAHPIARRWVDRSVPMPMRLLDDMAFIARARTDVPALCDIVEAQGRQIERLRAVLLEVARPPRGLHSPAQELYDVQRYARAALEVKP